MRPSGFARRRELTYCSPTMRAPWMAPGSFAMTAVRPGLAGLISLGSGQLGVFGVQAADLGLQDPHGPAQGARCVRQLLRPEQHDQYDRDDQYLPRAVEKVTDH